MNEQKKNNKLKVFISTAENVTDLKLSIFFENLGWIVNYQPSAKTLSQFAADPDLKIVILAFDKIEKPDIVELAELLKKYPDLYLAIITPNIAEGIKINENLKFHKKIFSVNRNDLINALNLLLSSFGNETKTKQSESDSLSSVEILKSEKITKRVNIINSIFSFLEKISGSQHTGLRDMLQQYLNLTVSTLQAERGSIMIFDEKNELITWAATSHELVGDTLKVDGKSLFAVAFSENRTIVVERDQSSYEGKISDKAKILTVIPIRYEGAAIGTFNIEFSEFKDELMQDYETVISCFSAVIISSLMGGKARKERNSLEKATKLLNKTKHIKESVSFMMANNLRLPVISLLSNLKIFSKISGNIPGSDLIERSIDSIEEIFKILESLIGILTRDDQLGKLKSVDINLMEVLLKQVAEVKKISQIKDKEFNFAIDKENYTVKSDQSILSHLFLSLIVYLFTSLTDIIGVTIAMKNEIDYIFVEFFPKIGSGQSKSELQVNREKISGMEDSSFKREAKKRNDTTLLFCQLAVEAVGGLFSQEYDKNGVVTIKVRIPRTL